SAKKAPPKPAAPRAANASATSGNSPPLTNTAQPSATPAVGRADAQRGAPATSSTISYGPHTGQGPHAAGHTATSPTANQATGHGANSGHGTNAGNSTAASSGGSSSGARRHGGRHPTR